MGADKRGLNQLILCLFYRLIRASRRNSIGLKKIREFRVYPRLKN